MENVYERMLNTRIIMHWKRLVEGVENHEPVLSRSIGFKYNGAIILQLLRWSNDEITKFTTNIVYRYFEIISYHVFQTTK